MAGRRLVGNPRRWIDFLFDSVLEARGNYISRASPFRCFARSEPRSVLVGITRLFGGRCLCYYLPGDSPLSVYLSQPVKPLDLSDIHRLRAAEGWLELGDEAEALRELEDISPAEKNHPAVLELRFQILAKKREWDACRDIAGMITQQLPNFAGGWLHLAYATRRATGGSEQAAFDILQPVSGKFPEEPTIPYNLACYVCQLGNLSEARQWLKRAFALGDTQQIKLMALNDADLKPLWEEIPRMEG